MSESDRLLGRRSSTFNRMKIYFVWPPDCSSDSVQTEAENEKRKSIPKVQRLLPMPIL
jgi:hypothetical protein